MSIPLTINGAVFEYPENFDENWGIEATGWAQAVTNGMLQRAGGNFPLLADVNFGPNFGLLSKYFETRSTNPSTVGTIRLSSADAGIGFRNNANSANLILTTDSSDNLVYPNDLKAAGLILPDTEVSPKTVTVSAPTTLSATWALALPINAGSNGQVLSTDGAGHTSWINAAGGGTVDSGTGGNFSWYATSGTTLSDSGISVTTPFFTTVQLRQTTNQLSFTGGGGGNQVRTLNIAPTTTVGEVVTIPDAGTSANVILSQGTPAFGVALSMGSNQIHSVSDPTSAQDAATKNYVDSVMPPGAMVDFAGTSAPSGWLLCDGSAISRSTYANLFSAIGTTWGPGDGSTTFNIPNMQRRVSMGSGGSGSGTIGNATGNTGGAETHTMTTGELVAHNHTANSVVTDPGHRHVFGQYGVAGGTTTEIGNPSNANTSTTLNTYTGTSGVQSATTGISVSTTTTNTGSTTPFNIIQPAAIVTKIIKT